MNIIRKYKISKLLNQPLEGVEQEIVLFIQEWLKGLIPFKYSDYPNSIFYMKADTIFVLEYRENGDLLIRYKSFWGVLTDRYSMEYDDIQNILKYMIEALLNQKITTVYPKGFEGQRMIESVFKKELK